MGQMTGTQLREIITDINSEIDKISLSKQKYLKIPNLRLFSGKI